MFSNLNGFIVKDAISNSMVENIYDSLKNLSENSKHVVENLGLITYFMDFKNFDNEFKNNLLNIVQPNFNIKLKPTEIAFGRYSFESGYVSKLFPHYDNFDSPRITLDIQLKSNISWPIYVEENEFILNDKDAVIFSASDQIHWRKNISLNKGDYVDMLFVLFGIDNNNYIISEEQKSEREKKLNYFYNKVQITKEAIKI